jgi:superfamily II DNA helicase RecQ
MDTFTYVSAFRVFICTLCEHIVSPSGIADHIRTQQCHQVRNHRNRVAEFREYFAKFPNCLGSIQHFVVPQTPIALVTQLPSPQPGYRCLECPKIVRCIRKIQAHCRDDHFWLPPRKRGRPRKNASNPLLDVASLPWKTVSTQRFIHKGGQNAYFEVRSTASTVLPASPPPSDQSFAEKRQELRDRIQAVQEAQNKAISSGDPTEVNAWLDMVNWVSHLSAYTNHRKQLRSLLEIPKADVDYGVETSVSEDGEPMIIYPPTPPPSLLSAGGHDPGVEQLFIAAEPILALICKTFDEIIRAGQHTVSHRVNWWVKHEINRKEAGVAPRSPFRSALMPATMVRYRQIWKQLICYTIRSHIQQTHFESVETSDSFLDSDSESEEDTFPREARFRFSPSQESSYRTMWNKCERHLEKPKVSPVSHDDSPLVVPRLRTLHRNVIYFLISLLEHEVHGDEFNSALLSGLAVLGLDPDNGWATAINYTPTLSAVVRIARILVVQHAWEQAEFEKKPKRCQDLVKQYVRAYMVVDKPVPMSRIYHMRTYGLKIRYSTTAKGQVDWTGHGRQSKYFTPGVEFTKMQFETLVRGMLYECRHTLLEKLLLIDSDSLHATTSLPLIPWESLRDNAGCATPGWNFTYDKKALWPDIDASMWLWDRIQLVDKFRTVYLQDAHLAGPRPFKKSALQELTLHIRRFQELLLVLVHLCCGLPPRGSEILSCKHSNTPNSRRNFFIEDGMVVFVTEYHKGYSISGSTKIIHRYLPREVGELFVYYMWLVLPFEQIITINELQGQELSPFMWTLDSAGSGPHRFKSQDLTKLLQCESVRYMGVLGRLGLASYRHCAVAFSRRFCGEDGFQEEGGDEEDQEDDIEAVYTGQDAVSDLQAGHGTHTAGMIYARGVDELDGAVQTLRARFRKESIKWHINVLGFKPYIIDSVIQSRINSLTTQQSKKRQHDEYLALRKINIQDYLEKLLGRKARFRGLQQAAIQAIINRENPVICVMGTGAGKSLLFQLPVMCQPTTTSIVVVPNISLREDMIRRSREAGILSHEWKDRAPSTFVQMVFAVPEATISHAFQMYMDQMRREGSLARVVIDECHVVLDGNLTFRPQLLELATLLRYSVQMVYLTATLPPEDEHDLFALLQIDPYRAQVMRASTTRANVRYQVHTHDGAQRSIINFIRREHQRCRDAGGSLIVYSHRRTQVDALAAALQCPGYHSDISLGRRSEIFNDLRSGKIDLVVATNGLGYGIDIPNIYGVVHAEKPFKLRDYAQESGRAGRNGKRAIATILQPGTSPLIDDWRVTPKICHITPIRTGGETQVGMFCEGKQCRRVVLDAYLDGHVFGQRDRLQCEADEETCDVCERRATEVQKQQREDAAEYRQREEQSRRAAEWQAQVNRVSQAQRTPISHIALMLARCHQRCPVCLVHQQKELHHSLQQCQHPDAQKVQDFVRQSRRCVKWDKYSCCWECGVPQAICERYEPHGEQARLFQLRRGMKVACQYPDTVIPMTAALLLCGPLKLTDVIRASMAADKVQFQDIPARTKWLAKRDASSGVEMNVAMRILIRMVREIAEDDSWCAW